MLVSSRAVRRTTVRISLYAREVRPLTCTAHIASSSTRRTIPSTPRSSRGRKTWVIRSEWPIAAHHTSHSIIWPKARRDVGATSSVNIGGGYPARRDEGPPVRTGVFAGQGPTGADDRLPSAYAHPRRDRRGRASHPRLSGPAGHVPRIGR